MTQQNSLHEKYYKGESTLEEEKQLKESEKANELNSIEKHVFALYNKNSAVPADIESDLFAAVSDRAKKSKGLRLKLFSYASAAAVALVVLAVYLDFRKARNAQMEDNFFVMEQALFQISESLQNQEVQEEMFVLWVDDDVEIILK